jgi:hypothetical protein
MIKFFPSIRVFKEKGCSRLSATLLCSEELKEEKEEGNTFYHYERNFVCLGLPLLIYR